MSQLFNRNGTPPPQTTYRPNTHTLSGTPTSNANPTNAYDSDVSTNAVLGYSFGTNATANMVYSGFPSVTPANATLYFKRNSTAVYNPAGSGSSGTYSQITEYSVNNGSSWTQLEENMAVDDFGTGATSTTGVGEISVVLPGSQNLSQVKVRVNVSRFRSGISPDFDFGYTTVDIYDVRIVGS